MELDDDIDASWSRDETSSMTRKVKCVDFADAFSLGTAIALLAEREGHHPELRIGWGYLEIHLTTHAVRGLTENDYIMAAKVDALTEQ